MRLGVAWAVAVAVSLAIEPLRPYGLAVLYGVVAGFAARSVVDAQRGDRASSDRWIAALGASALPVLATVGARGFGGGLILLAAACYLACFVSPDPERSLLERSGHMVAAAGICGGAAASLVLLADYEIGAVIILLAFAMVYDASDFTVGSGPSGAVFGPVAGALFIVAVSLIFAVTGAPPFRGAAIWLFAALAMVACPAGQFVASALLPHPDERAPGLRRLDSLLVAAPAWAGLVGLFIGHAR